MKTLIVYYSHTNNNEVLAKELQKRLLCSILKIEETGKRTGFTIFMDVLFRRNAKIKEHHLSLMDYDNFIFIGPIWAGQIASPLKTFLIKERNEIRRYSFITICGGIVGQKEKITEKLTKLMHRAPEKVEELWINDLLTADKKDTVKYTTAYRIQNKDLSAFKEKIADFLKVHEVPVYHQ